MSYPPGAAHDSRAPYNQPPAVRCEDCNGTGWVPINDDPDCEDEEQCHTCEGSGWVPAMDFHREREYEREDDYDR